MTARCHTETSRCSAIATARWYRTSSTWTNERTGKTRGHGSRALAEPRQGGGQRLEPRADPLGVHDCQRLQQPAEARPARATPARRRPPSRRSPPTARREAPAPACGLPRTAQPREHGPPPSPPRVAPMRRQEHQPDQAEAAIDEDDGGGQRLRAGRARRVADAHHVAADIARQEVVEETRHEVRGDQRSERHGHTLCVEQQPPAPRIGQHVDAVEAEGHEQPGHRRALRAGPELSGVDAREQHGEQRDADHGLHEEDRGPGASRPGWHVLVFDRHPKDGRGDCTTVS